MFYDRVATKLGHSHGRMERYSWLSDTWSLVNSSLVRLFTKVPTDGLSKMNLSKTFWHLAEVGTHSLWVDFNNEVFKNWF